MPATDKKMKKRDDGEGWAGGLCGCASAGEEDECHMCLFAFLCPAIVYGVNYSTVTQAAQPKICERDCLWPCIVHCLADTCISSIALGICFNGTGASVILPLACCLRYTHRRAALDIARAATRSSIEEEKWYCTLAKEALCWGCSMAQVHRMFTLHNTAAAAAAKSAPVTKMHGFLILGTLSVPPSLKNSIAGADTQPLLLPVTASSA